MGPLDSVCYLSLSWDKSCPADQLRWLLRGSLGSRLPKCSSGDPTELAAILFFLPSWLGPEQLFGCSHDSKGFVAPDGSRTEWSLGTTSPLQVWTVPPAARGFNSQMIDAVHSTVQGLDISVNLMPAESLGNI